ncbi:glycosyltransferase family 2 protein [Maribellus maritimus]|uniref:glycosyltransferase family 2 protein n=1 Tax=Maribellus maritimus TaxID=2870838 RepID=UPI001EEA4403|nr:glycosyltransferase [Maribellus maritimus]MCG6188145.1 glycosyltransferase [Maribellus maritimus]
MINFSFVILHYQTIEDTITCVDSILKNIVYSNYSIIIVDNGSTNESGIYLKNKYLKNKNIHVLESPKNLGFARGNNLGFSFAKYKLKSEFICLLNNDTYIKQDDFVEEILRRYYISNFHILGPDIISTVDGKHQNPRRVLYTDLKIVKQYLRHFRIMRFLNLFLLDKVLVDFKKKFYSKSYLPSNDQEESYKDEKTGLLLHGSCLIFSPLYIANYDGLYPKTFMYSEESILNFISHRDNLISLYYPKVKIYHNEDSSTNYQYPKSYRKRRFYYKNIIKSLVVLTDLMKGNNNERM